MKALVYDISVPRWVLLKAVGSISRGFYYKGPMATVKLKDVPEPELPSAEWVRIKTAACGFCGSDLNLIFLRDSPTASPFTSFPCIFGHEVVGEISETGDQVSGFITGDRVVIAPHLDCRTRGIKDLCEACRKGFYGSCENVAAGDFSPGLFTGICSDIGGGFAPCLVAHKSQLFKLPDSFSWDQGVLLEPLAVALQAVWDNRPQDSDEVLIIGGGVIGTMVVKAIRGLDIGCRITVSEPSPFHAETVRQAGADKVIADGDILGAASGIENAVRYKPLLGKDIMMGGYDNIFDTVGSSETLNLALRCMTAGGTMSVIGIGHDVKLDLTPFWLKLQTLKGVFAYGSIEVDGQQKHIFDLAIELVEKGGIVLDGLVTHRFPIDRYREMIEVNRSKSRNKAIKTIITFD